MFQVFHLCNGAFRFGWQITGWYRLRLDFFQGNSKVHARSRSERVSGTRKITASRLTPNAMTVVQLTQRHPPAA